MESRSKSPEFASNRCKFVNETNRLGSTVVNLITARITKNERAQQALRNWFEEIVRFFKFVSKLSWEGTAKFDSRL